MKVKDLYESLECDKEYEVYLVGDYFNKKDVNENLLLMKREEYDNYHQSFDQTRYELEVDFVLDQEVHSFYFNPKNVLIINVKNEILLKYCQMFSRYKKLLTVDEKKNKLADKQELSNEEMFKEMLNLQQKYDNAVFEEFDTEYDAIKCQLALFDELGEVNHEIKKLWCYWRHSQESINDEKLLEELADCWHFALSFYYNSCLEIYGTLDCEEVEYDITDLFKYHKTELPENSTLYNLSWYELKLEKISNPSSAFSILENLLEVSTWCNFSWDEIYEGYKKKNKTNWKRLESGY